MSLGRVGVGLGRRSASENGLIVGDGGESARLPEALQRLGLATARVGTGGFAAALADLLRFAGGFENLMIAAFSDRRRPEPVYSDLSAEEARVSLTPYIEHAYRGDPWFDLVQGGVRDGVFRLEDFIGRGFKRTLYYRDYYQQTRLRDECAILVRPNPGTALVLSMGLRTPDPERRGRTELLHLLEPCILALCRLHWADLPAGGGHGPAIAADDLSRRERQVLDLVLGGRSNKDIARVLALSPETVKVYRKRINRKLKISSATELFCAMIKGDETASCTHAG